MKKLFLIMLMVTIAFADCTKSGDIVTDNDTGLMWQDDTNANTIHRTWIGAINYCEGLSLGGYSDWRLPNINELLSITDNTKDYTNIKSGFTNISYAWYWSSSTDTSYGRGAWVVSFGDFSRLLSIGKGSIISIRCVR